MKYKTGQVVAFSFMQHALDTGASLFFKTDFLIKGKIEKVKTHDLFLFKRREPVYKVNGIWVKEKTLKPVIRIVNS